MQSQRLRSHEPMSPPLTPINPSRQLESRVPASCKFPVSCDVSIGAAERAPTRAAEYSPATREGGVVKCAHCRRHHLRARRETGTPSYPDRSADDHRICHRGSTSGVHRAPHKRHTAARRTARSGHQRRAHREVPCRWPTASPVRVGRDDLGSLSNLVDLLAAPV